MSFNSASSKLIGIGRTKFSDFTLKSQEEIKNRSTYFKFVHMHYRWFINLACDRVTLCPHGTDRIDVPPEERNHEDVVSFDRVFDRNVGTPYATDYYTFAQLPTLFS